MYDSYIICGTPRTGSTLLCGLLAATGQAGKPDSFFSRRFMGDWAREWGLAADEPDYESRYLAAAIAAGRGGTRLFGLRLMRENVADLVALLDAIQLNPASDSEKFAGAFGRILYVHLSRRDKLAQAVSRIKAEQTGLWHIGPDGREIERLAPPKEPRYDFQAIHGELQQLERHDAAWADWFSAQQITPQRISYEDLATNPADGLGMLCGALGVPAPDRSLVIPGVAVLSDAINSEWIRRYLADAASLPERK